MKKLILTSAMVMGMIVVAHAQTTWNIDTYHSTIGFTVDHMVVSEVDGRFDEFQGSLVTSKEDLTDARITFSAKTASVNTGIEKRDGHLKSGDFFDAEKYPEIAFTSTSFNQAGEGKYKLVGELTMHGVTKSVELDAKFNGTINTPQGVKAGFKVSGVINRKDFGLTYNSVLEAGGVAIGEEVTIDVKLEMNKG